MEADLKVGDKVTFRSFTFPPDQKEGKGVVTNVNPYYQWRRGLITLITIKGDDNNEYRINSERVKKV